MSIFNPYPPMMSKKARRMLELNNMSAMVKLIESHHCAFCGQATTPETFITQQDKDGWTFYGLCPECSQRCSGL